jgi:PAS domain S-box-containing protein
LFISRGLTKEKIINEEREKNQKKTTETKAALFNILEDIKESERKFQEERDRSQAIISSMGEGLVVIDRNYKIIMTNKTADSLLEAPLGGMIGRDAKEVVTILKGEQEISADERPAAKTFKTGETVVIKLEDNYYLKLPSGKKFPAEIISTPLRGDGIMAAVVIFQDITKEKSLDEAKSSFISIASHQLRTPLTSIRWYAEMLDSEDTGPLNKDQKEFVGRVYGGALKLNEVINLLLSLARIESGKTQQELVKINFDTFTQDIVKELDPLLKQKKLKVETILPKEPLPEISYDASILRQMVTNLLSNSIRYTNNEGKIEIKIEKMPGSIVYSVKDDGIGVPDKQKDKIFNKFFRAENAMSKVPDGSGLGLSLVKALVEMNKGSVWFESPALWVDKDGKEEKKGTVFHFTIPI